MTLEAVPPGQHPTSMTPMASSGGRWNAFAKSQARAGMTMNCARQPMMTSLGRLNTTLKSLGLSVRPMPNITSPSKGLMQTVSIHLKLSGNSSATTATNKTITPTYREMKLHISFIPAFCCLNPLHTYFVLIIACKSLWRNSSNFSWFNTPESQSASRHSSAFVRKYFDKTSFTSSNLDSEPSKANIFSKCCCTGLNIVVCSIMLLLLNCLDCIKHIVFLCGDLYLYHKVTTLFDYTKLNALKSATVLRMVLSLCVHLAVLMKA